MRRALASVNGVILAAGLVLAIIDGDWLRAVAWFAALIWFANHLIADHRADLWEREARGWQRLASRRRA